MNNNMNQMNPLNQQNTGYPFTQPNFTGVPSNYMPNYQPQPQNFQNNYQMNLQGNQVHPNIQGYHILNPNTTTNTNNTNSQQPPNYHTLENQQVENNPASSAPLTSTVHKSSQNINPNFLKSSNTVNCTNSTNNDITKNTLNKKAVDISNSTNLSGNAPNNISSVIKTLKDSSISVNEQNVDTISHMQYLSFKTDDNIKRPFTEKVGDWVCYYCKNLNFSFRTTCNRCKVSKINNAKFGLEVGNIESQPKSVYNPMK
eukprot:CAMPEP_0170527860 /NCGR_PEP_ID=MMETSP0209-20121228/13348_1 /TAXON_ID=665100 ORGANISM="Litonotus pictus, Strain P1" /NCGR_SAMPLE_ID=MMETSP0209 /ASSEMBLY_ACC=CAM_ASM_000301 /LENGTH=256 /DNA_ID=CAMNT_0010818697 /DNA_START=398 /DNA_END=1168 /DNA_ORIENTATION=-